VPPEWFTHLPTGYLPGLAVQVCLPDSTMSNAPGAPSVALPADPTLISVGSTGMLMVMMPGQYRVCFKGPAQNQPVALLCVQTFVPYGRPYALPLPLVAPTAVTASPDVNFPDVSAGGLMTLANATSNFALRFSGEIPALNPSSRCLTRHAVWPQCSLTWRQ